MYIILLYLHMIGLTIGAGTGIYLAAVNRHAARNLDQAEARTLIPGVNGVISRVGTIGLGLLLVSGIGMTMILGPAIFNTMFVVKMALVLVIVMFVGSMQILAWRVRHLSDTRAATTMRKIGPLGPVLAALTLAAAVGAFH